MYNNSITSDLKQTRSKKQNTHSCVAPQNEANHSREILKERSSGRNLAPGVAYRHDSLKASLTS